MFIQNMVKSSFFGVIALFPVWIYLSGRWLSLQQCAEGYADQYFPLLHYRFSAEVGIVVCCHPQLLPTIHASACILYIQNV